MSLNSKINKLPTSRWIILKKNTQKKQLEVIILPWNKSQPFAARQNYLSTCMVQYLKLLLFHNSDVSRKTNEFCSLEWWHLGY